MTETPTPCIWTPSPGDWCETEYWDTGCGQTYCFETEGPVENDYAYCPGCGHPLLVVPTIMSADEEGDLLFDAVQVPAREGGEHE